MDSLDGSSMIQSGSRVVERERQLNAEEKSFRLGNMKGDYVKVIKTSRELDGVQSLAVKQSALVYDRSTSKEDTNAASHSISNVAKEQKSKVTAEERSIACLTKRNQRRLRTKSGNIAGSYSESKGWRTGLRLKRASLIVETIAVPQETD
ncbi:hypothetical protein HN011_005485 [Eciton burchellii]|nr:hypothetical protein HN011_005485 [Eciton burchellii]